ncbi:hypothetical protein SEA_PHRAPPUCCINO_162 [Mycobacterium phage Phrappuccino]|uniref:Uncharacterized protein n=1 Tax=Mycobacterium phage Phrappuccino TaxID=2591223 RepID=A0A514DE18_9CAUD|nr:hypothetical protein KHQ87_gp162 [Mycobacterium phage Phrappuccino]QDH91837.1 hypothetical protein SEA_PHRAPPUCCINO_162 [Mycobacterium phage Phrappuccino]QIQ63279.1 hypothetical protein SEA_SETTECANDELA_162 [Mycobacterium phage Settecandela]
MKHVISLVPSGRGAGLSTALLDIALANASRGDLVWMLAGTPAVSRAHQRRVLELLKEGSHPHARVNAQGTEVAFDNGGRVLFFDPVNSPPRGSAVADMEITDREDLARVVRTGQAPSAF